MSSGRDFSGGPVERIHFPMQGMQVQSLVRELSSHKPRGMAKKENGRLKKTKITKLQTSFGFTDDSLITPMKKVKSRNV